MRLGSPLRIWVWAHRWSSLLCTFVLLLMCVTGLPLIFHDELDTWMGVGAHPHAAGAALKSVDDLIAAGERLGGIVQYVVWEQERTGLVTLVMGKAIDSDMAYNWTLYADAVSGQIVPPNRVVEFILTLHAQMFLGTTGPLVLSAMVLLLIVSLVSGVVVYAPFMRRLPFGTVRSAGARNTRTLDRHNLVGVVLVGWLLIVGFTGMVNTWGPYVIATWQADQVSSLAAPFAARPIPKHTVPIDKVVQAAQSARPDMTLAFLAPPGTIFTTRRHYAVFMRGDSTLTSRLITPVFVDAVTGKVSAAMELPGYAQAALLAEPLHFGDYGGLILKLLWAAMDLLTIFVAVSGIALWRRAGVRRVEEAGA
jgi:uncharacterized iron-regulated membrane protein